METFLWLRTAAPPSNRLLACSSRGRNRTQKSTFLICFCCSNPLHSVSLPPSLPPSLNQLPSNRPPRPTDVIIIKWRGKTTLSWFKMIFISDVGKIILKGVLANSRNLGSAFKGIPVHLTYLATIGFTLLPREFVERKRDWPALRVRA